MPKINFLGLELNVLDEETINEQLRNPNSPRVVVVSRVADLPGTDWGSPALRARRTRTICEGCQQPCWLDPASYAEVAILSPEILCVQCMMARLRTAEKARNKHTA